MSKYQFQRLGSNAFQEMVQSLLEKKRRNVGELIQFGSAGADGAREATWIQPPGHPDYIRPTNAVADVPKHWVFQVKFHDIGLRGWAGAGAAVLADLKAELEKVTSKYNIRCHHYVMITNVPLTGACRIGTRDKVTKIAIDWKSKIPQVEVWDAADLSRMLDNNPDVRTAYNELILPGDVLSALHREISDHADRRMGSFLGYLKHLIDNESKARAEEAGDDDPLPLSKVFIDQTLQLDKQDIPDGYRDVVETWATDSIFEEESPALVPDDLDEVSSSFPLLWGAQEKAMLLAGPGYGKSTITQFLALYHAGRIISPTFAATLAKRLKLPNGWTAKDLDASCTMRFPFRIELRRYAKWRKTVTDESPPVGIASYIARQLIGGVVESDLDHEDIFSLISDNPTLLILDGLDEVPNKDDRDAILRDFDAFLYRCSGEGVDLQIVVSSRPQGYHGEFDRFQPLRWVINDLNEDDFNKYSADWLSERIKNREERSEAEDRIKRGMASDAVRRLATTLLQATVMLTIVRKKSDIPEERHKLFEKYVEVVFQREKAKNDLIARYEPELRLLHETVGYEIHEGVARGEAGVMPEQKFKELVWKVWRLVRGDEQLHGVPNHQIERIYELSTDRLVFLSGKGTNQTDIDFVIQPYREYFAASYMSNHAEANPEKVFSCLVERGAYWQQVLRFYSAIAKPTQQLAWTYGAALPPMHMDPLDGLTKSLQTKRAVIYSLPEFGRFQFEHVKKAISGCLPENEWWTWLGQAWVIPILGGLRAGEAWRELWKIFMHSPIASYGSEKFALWFFPHVIPNAAREYSDFIAFVSDRLRSGKLAKLAMEAILLHALPVDLKQEDEKVLFEVLESYPYTRRFRHTAVTAGLVKKLPRPLALRFICTLERRYYHELGDRANAWEYMGLPVVAKEIEPFEIDTTNGPIIGIVIPGWLRFSIEGQRCLPAIDSSESDGSYGVYIRALFAALQNPEDPEIYQKAKASMMSLPREVEWSLHCENVLGPSPEQFSSTAEWCQYKANIRQIFDKPGEIPLLREIASTFNATLEERRNDWAILLLPPSQWDYLVNAGILQPNFVAQLRGSMWAKTASLSKEYVEFATVFRQYASASNTKIEIPFLGLMQIAVTLHNKCELFESEIANQILGLVNVENIDVGHVHDLINSIENPSKLARTWAAALFRIAIRLDGIDLKFLCDIWAEVNKGRENTIWLGLMYTQSDMSRNVKIANQLLGLNDDIGLDLATQILADFSEIPLEVSYEISRRAISGLRHNKLSDGRKRTLVRCLLQSKPTAEEVGLYRDTSIFRSIYDAHPQVEDQITTRLRAMPQSLKREQFPSLRSELMQLLSVKENYDPEICAATIDALIQLDVLSCAPMTESDWQTNL